MATGRQRVMSLNVEMQAPYILKRHYKLLMKLTKHGLLLAVTLNVQLKLCKGEMMRHFSN